MYEKHEDGNGNIIKISRSFYDLSHLIYQESMCVNFTLTYSVNNHRS